MTVKWEGKVLKCDNREVYVQSSWWVYQAGCILGGCVIDLTHLDTTRSMYMYAMQ